MNHTSSCLSLLASILLILLCFHGLVDAHKNYTVGDSLGWFDKLSDPDIDYQKWAAGKPFSLGDFLIFRTDNNHSVVQTYNFTTYKACDYTGDDSIEWSSSDPSSTAISSVTVAVPLLKEGETYFFSGDYDGWQCKHGQGFKINVVHGQGLPPSLRDVAEEPSLAPQSPSDSGDEESAPDTVVSSNFNNPKNSTHSGSDDDKKDGQSSSSHFVLGGVNFVGSLVSCVIVLLGVC